MVVLVTQVAGVTVELRAAAAGLLDALPLGGFAGAPGAAPDLVIELAGDPQLEGRPPAADHPAFARHREGDDLVVERADVVGRIALAGTPLRARFAVAGDLYAREAAVRVALSVALPRRGGLILHASAVAPRGAAHVFTGVSGAGKSTIARLLDGLPGCQRLADELLVVVREPEGWHVHVPPVLGIAGLPLGARVPLASVELLAQAPAHARTPRPAALAIRELLRHVVVYASEPHTAGAVLALVERLVREVPCHRLAFAPDPSVGAVLGIT
jgi:hypothetical protein